MPPARHPITFAVLYVPFGVINGFASVALAFMATKRGLSIDQGALLIAASLVPQVWKFLWAPVADATLSRSRWYLISVVVIAAGLFGVAALPLGPSNFVLIETVIVVASVATTFLGFAVEAMVAQLTPPEDMGRAGGWMQAGNLGGSGIGGGLGLWLLSVMPAAWEAGLILAILVVACAAALPFVPDIPADKLGTSPANAARQTLAELWNLARSRDGALCALLCFLPVGTGTASGVLGQADVAAFWGVGSTAVSLVQGVFGGLFSMVGCIVGGYGCSRFGARAGYAIYGAVMAAVTLVMAVMTRTPGVYVVGGLLYQFVTGLNYAAFSAVVLQAIGAKLAATKYNCFASLSNTPIWYMGLLLAAVETALGPRNMLLAESVFGAAGIMIFLGTILIWRPKAGTAALAA